VKRGFWAIVLAYVILDALIISKLVNLFYIDYLDIEWLIVNDFRLVCNVAWIEKLPHTLITYFAHYLSCIDLIICSTEQYHLVS